MNTDSQKTVDLCRKTRDDYLNRMKSIYDDHDALVKDTRRRIDEVSTELKNEFKTQKNDFDVLSKRLNKIAFNLKDELDQQFSNIE